jgi:hypothetical protein
MLNKNLIYQAPHEQLQTAENPDANKIIEKIYSSTVFQEFIKQWGDVPVRYQYTTANEAEQKKV